MLNREVFTLFGRPHKTPNARICLPLLSLPWSVMQSMLVAVYWCFGTTYPSRVQWLTFGRLDPLKMGPVGCLETSESNVYAVQKDTHSFLMSNFIFITYVSSTCFGPHRPIIRSVLYKLYLQTLVCGNTVRTARHVQLLQSNGCTKRSWSWTSEVRNMSSWHMWWIKLNH